MRFSSLAPVVLLFPAFANACEGECITGVTNAWLSHYIAPINSVFAVLANQIALQLIPSDSQSAASDYIDPILTAYSTRAYAELETAIFPSYFHGKCQQDGIDPPGCPDPDCPVVCGTPGSLVHFFPHLRYIVFNQTRNLLAELGRPGTDAYTQVERLVLAHATQLKPRMVRRYLPAGVTPEELRARDEVGPPPKTLAARTEDVKTQLQDILGQVGPMLEKTCGGSGTGESNGLPNCSWEDELKKLILSYP